LLFREVKREWPLDKSDLHNISEPQNISGVVTYGSLVHLLCAVILLGQFSDKNSDIPIGERRRQKPESVGPPRKHKRHKKSGDKETDQAHRDGDA